MSDYLNLQSMYKEIRKTCVARYAPFKDGVNADVFPNIVNVCEKMISYFGKKQLGKERDKLHKQRNGELSESIRKRYFDLYDDPSENYFYRNKTGLGVCSDGANPYEKLQAVAREMAEDKNCHPQDVVICMNKILLLLKDGDDIHAIKRRFNELLVQYGFCNL